MKSLKYYDKNRHATWLELFFDLIFVVAIGKVTHISVMFITGTLSLSKYGRFYCFLFHYGGSGLVTRFTPTGLIQTVTLTAWQHCL